MIEFDKFWQMLTKFEWNWLKMGKLSHLLRNELEESFKLTVQLVTSIVVPKHSLPPFLAIGLLHARVRQKHLSPLFTPSEDCEQLNQSPHDDQPPSIGAVKTGQSVAFWIQNLASVSPFGGGVQAVCKSFHPQYGSMALRQLTRDTCRLQCSAGILISDVCVPI